jgi:hypothetical protein
MHQRLKNVLDGDEILITLPGLVQGIFQYALTAVPKFVFIRTQINHLLPLTSQKKNLVHYFVTAGLLLFKTGTAKTALLRRLDVPSIFAVAFQCNKISRRSASSKYAANLKSFSGNLSTLRQDSPPAAS